ncbi:uncharacterized protein MYCGRDRAFT_91543 [Zymoseptoria tritici IPO323]|uniref:Uncharacterized protein n=1 Tax=Zymoseptoria tritici (strain CBS 115943 / IPO323) TaxID=336722 RepID=F9X658_ZYMTI|nr:uncharacterized protein MYCGRDRAFT_91543 [Zymoseptoria tritici IPO323]EGP88719.1 hypothetical protein MYCGRDRAFT_91543 [Zymoseptoria tritici IPO323]
MPTLKALLKALLETAIIVAAARSVQNAITTFNHYTTGTGKVAVSKTEVAIDGCSAFLPREMWRRTHCFECKKFSVNQSSCIRTMTIKAFLLVIYQIAVLFAAAVSVKDAAFGFKRHFDGDEEVTLLRCVGGMLVTIMLLGIAFNAVKRLLDQARQLGRVNEENQGVQI